MSSAYERASCRRSGFRNGRAPPEAAWPGGSWGTTTAAGQPASDWTSHEELRPAGGATATSLLEKPLAEAASPAALGSDLSSSREPANCSRGAAVDGGARNTVERYGRACAWPAYGRLGADRSCFAVGAAARLARTRLSFAMGPGLTASSSKWRCSCLRSPRVLFS